MARWRDFAVEVQRGVQSVDVPNLVLNCFPTWALNVFTVCDDLSRSSFTRWTHQVKLTMKANRKLTNLVLLFCVDTDWYRLGDKRAATKAAGRSSTVDSEEVFFTFFSGWFVFEKQWTSRSRLCLSTAHRLALTWQCQRDVWPITRVSCNWHDKCAGR